MEEYELVRKSQRTHQFNINGKQMGDPEKAAAVMIAVSVMDDAPLHLLLGSDAYELADQKMDLLKANMLSVRKIATATAFEDSMVES
jgi:hypothetical protein